MLADKGTFNELCVKKSNGGEVCVTGDELENLLSGAGQTAAAAGVDGGGAVPPVPEPSPEIEILMNGSNPATLSVGDTYSDLGAVASTSNIAVMSLGIRTFYQDAEVTTLHIDTSVAGEHAVVYRIIDGEGTVLAEATRTVIVEDTTQEPALETVSDEPAGEETSTETATSTSTVIIEEQPPTETATSTSATTETGNGTSTSTPPITP